MPRQSSGEALAQKGDKSSTSANNARERGNAQRSPAPSKPGPGPSSSQGFAAAGMGSGNRTVPFMNLANDPLYQQALETARQSAVLAAAGATRHSAAKGAGAVVLASSAAAASTLTAAAPLAQTPTPLPPPPARSSRQQDAHHAPSNRSGAGSRGGLQADSASRRNDARGSTTPQPQWQQRSAEGPSSRQQTPEGSSQGNLNRALFNAHIDKAELSRGLKMGRYFAGKLRVNARDNREAYVTVDGLPMDVLIRGTLDQNRAIHDDTVYLQMQPLKRWFVINSIKSTMANADSASAPSPGPSSSAAAGDTPWAQFAGTGQGLGPQAVLACIARMQQERPELRPTGRIMAIDIDPTRPNPKRENIVGVLQESDQLASSSLSQSSEHTNGTSTTPVSAGAGVPSNARVVWLVPMDPKLPQRMAVDLHELWGRPEVDELMKEARGQVEGRTLMSARITSWADNCAYPTIMLRKSLGQAGEIESETAAILEMENIRHAEFTPEVLACLPPTPWTISKEEAAKRKDFRSTRVFSIDPPTAKDLDDALSIEPLPNGKWRVGVHIADVAHFIPPYSALDVEAGMRATSTYLVQRVIPMLPKLLCEELCSLNPGVERLSFSVVWDLDAEGNIESTWFGRGIIKSCAKLAYPHVQAMIEGRFDPTAPEIAERIALHGAHAWADVISDSLALWSLASKMRARRFDSGALRLDNVKLCYALDRDGNPVTASPYVQAEANQLVEEFMLLANMSVAQKISESFPDRAMLRRHPPPNASKLALLQEVADAAGAKVDLGSAGSLQASLQALRDDPSLDPLVLEVIILSATKPMQLAEYFCTGQQEEPAAWRHYALAVPAYTHFTSPIRRYPDVVVHRLLAAALEADTLQASRGTAVKKGNATASSSSPAATAPAGAAGAGASTRPSSPLSADVVSKVTTEHQLFDCGLAGKVADHCNERRLAARNAQDGSLRLYLTAMLRRFPSVSLATVQPVKGEKWMDVYLHQFGCEAKIAISDLGIPVKSFFNSAAKVLSLNPVQDTSTDAGQARSNCPGQRRSGFGRGNGNGSSSGGDAQDTGAPDYATWLASLPPVLNPHCIPPVQLPLHISALTQLPVVVTAVSRPGQLSELIVRIYLGKQELAAAVAELAGNEAEAAQKLQELGDHVVEGAAAQALLSCEAAVMASIPWGEQLND